MSEQRCRPRGQVYKDLTEVTSCQDRYVYEHVYVHISECHERQVGPECGRPARLDVSH